MKKKKYGYYRNMRTRAEMRAACTLFEDGEREQWGRRRPYSLDAWNLERPYGQQKSWKMCRRKQYNPNGRGQKHTFKIKLDELSWRQKWNFELYCRDNNIPYTIHTLTHKENRVQYSNGKWCIVRWEPCERQTKVDGVWKTVKDNRPIYGIKQENLAQPRKYNISVIDGYILTWWSNKDIGIKHILAKK
jgi:hypothetical protein